MLIIKFKTQIVLRSHLSGRPSKHRRNRQTTFCYTYITYTEVLVPRVFHINYYHLLTVIFTKHLINNKLLFYFIFICQYAYSFVKIKCIILLLGKRFRIFTHFPKPFEVFTDIRKASRMLQWFFNGFQGSVLGFPEG